MLIRFVYFSFIFVYVHTNIDETRSVLWRPRDFGASDIGKIPVAKRVYEHKCCTKKVRRYQQWRINGVSAENGLLTTRAQSRARPMSTREWILYKCNMHF